MEKMKQGRWLFPTAIFAAILSVVLSIAFSARAQTATDTNVNISARRNGKTTEVCVTNGAGGTAVPTTAFALRKAMELQNLGPNSIFCTVDGQAPLATGALGRRILSGDAWSIDAGSNIAVKCIAATAAQVTGACTQVTELR